MFEPDTIEDTRLDDVRRQLLDTTARLLEAIRVGDAETYSSLCAPDLSCYEDVCAHRIDGLEFHLHLVRRAALKPETQPVRQDILTPRVQVYGDCGVVTYTRLCTYDHADGLSWTTFNETRVFVRSGESWKLVHFHRSPTGG